MNLTNILKSKGARRRSKRVGRGIGSGKGGHTVGKGMKGQKSRKGSKFTPGFEGGQVPLYKRLPQIGGFKNSRSKQVGVINLSVLSRFKDGDKITPQKIIDLGVITRLPKDGIKILAGGKLDKKLILSGFVYSESAKEKIKKSGSEIND
jgi:large subunit ribosomal protein L15